MPDATYGAPALSFFSDFDLKHAVFAVFWKTAVYRRNIFNTVTVTAYRYNLKSIPLPLPLTATSKNPYRKTAPPKIPIPLPLPLPRKRFYRQRFFGKTAAVPTPGLNRCAPAVSVKTSACCSAILNLKNK